MQKLLKMSNATYTRGMSQYFVKDRLKGKTAIVTASTEGIGYAIVERLGLFIYTLN